MDELIVRYIGDVVRRLPDGEQLEVRRELEANILDMLPENPGRGEVVKVLEELGSPAALAEQYRQKPRYLISPATYDGYIRALKWILPLVGGVIAALGLVLGIAEGIGNEVESMSRVIGDALSSGVAMGVDGALQALIWTTVGFVIADRVRRGKPESWTVDDLPKVVEGDKAVIKLSDSITALVLITVFSVIAILVCAGAVPIVFSTGSSTTIYTLFSDSFLTACIPVIVIIALGGVAKHVMAMIYRRWTVPVCAVTVGAAVLDMGCLLYLAMRPDLFSEEFSGFISGLGWTEYIPAWFGGSGLLFVFCAILITATLAEISMTVWRTVKAHRELGTAACVAKGVR